MSVRHEHPLCLPLAKLPRVFESSQEYLVRAD